MKSCICVPFYSGINLKIELLSLDWDLNQLSLCGLHIIYSRECENVEEKNKMTPERSTKDGSGKYLFACIVDGRNIWANNLAGSLVVLEFFESIVGKDKLVVSTSSSLQHTAVDLVNETKLDDEIKSWLAFAAQMVVEVSALAKALTGHKDEAFFAANAATQASRKSSPRVNNEAVKKAADALRGSDHRRATNVSARLDAQQKKLNLPQTIELRRVRREYKAKK